MTTTVLGVEPQNAWFMVFSLTVIVTESIWIWYDYTYGEYAKTRRKLKKLEDSSKAWKETWNL